MKAMTLFCLIMTVLFSSNADADASSRPGHRAAGTR